MVPASTDVRGAGTGTGRIIMGSFCRRAGARIARPRVSRGGVVKEGGACKERTARCPDTATLHGDV